MNQAIQVLLFDLGGVLVELDRSMEKTAWFKPELSVSENWDMWLTSPYSQAFERGEIDAVTFASEFLSRNNINLDIDTFLRQFKDWVIGFYPGALPLLQQLSAKYTLAVFSNITEIHWPDIKSQLEQSRAVSHYFASYQIGRAKPSIEAFHYVLEQMAVAPQQVLFVDDNEINVAGARSAGIQSEVVKGFDQLESVLSRYHLL